MSRPKVPLPCKLFFTVIYHPSSDVSIVKAKLEGKVGNIEITSDIFPFDVTDYYAREMGHGLVRVFYVLSGVFERVFLVEAKLIAYDVEKECLSSGRRMFNIDAGVVTLENVLLSTFKNYYHRIYLGKGVYAEVTLAYMKKRFRELEWTYPDYRRKEVKSFFLNVREKLYDETIGKGLRHDTEYDGIREM